MSTSGHSGLAIPDRVRWAVNVLDPQPADRIIEVGGGPGASAELICQRLDSGILVAVDRSATAIARSRKRNAAYVADGRLRHIQSSLADLGWDDTPFDAFLCVDVNVFWTTKAGPELDAIERIVKPGGTVLILYGANSPSARTPRMQGIVRRLLERRFDNARVIAGGHGVGVRASAPD